jgi:hypothetical protein
MKIQPQSGLGDLIFALPLIYDIAQREEVEIATNHPYILEPLQKHGKITTSEIPICKDGIPIIKEGYTHLRYDRYGINYFEKYYTPYGRISLEESIKQVRKIYHQDRQSRISAEYAVYSPPRAARRHIGKKQEEIFSCTPEPIHAKKIIDSYNIPIVIIGQNEIFPPDFYMPRNYIDLRDTLDFNELCDLIANASCVISQVSSITALAGLFAVPTRFLKAASETEEQHDKHIQGVIWPGQEICK